MTRGSRPPIAPPRPSLRSNWSIAKDIVGLLHLHRVRPAARIALRLGRPRVSLRCARHGQGELESRAWADIARRQYPSPVRFDDRTADRKPHAHATGLGGVERLEQTVEVLHVQSRPGILDADKHAARRLVPGGDT